MFFYERTKSIIVLIGLVLLMSSCAFASAQSDSITDPANDVYIPGGQTGISNKPHIDIREITYAFGASGLTLTMRLQGTVSDSEGVTYTVTLDTGDASYVMTYDWGEWLGLASSEVGEFLPYFLGDEAGTLSGNTISMTFDSVGSSTTVVDFWGQAFELGGARDDVPNENGQTPPPDGNGGTTTPPDENGGTTTPPTGNGGTTVFPKSETFADPVGDVMYDYYDGTTLINYPVTDKPDIDITQISYTATADTVTLSMKVHGQIMFSEDAFYSLRLYSGSAGHGFFYEGSYEFHWNNGEYGSSYSCKYVETADDRVLISPISVDVTGNTITVTFERVCDFTEPIDFNGAASYGERDSDESWVDQAFGNGQITGGTGGTGGNGGAGGTPGFELIAVLVALGAAFILIKKRR